MDVDGMIRLVIVGRGLVGDIIMNLMKLLAMNILYNVFNFNFYEVGDNSVIITLQEKKKPDGTHFSKILR